MAITLICPNLRCRSILQVPDTTRGRKVRCGNCGKDFLVPENPARPARNTPTEPAGEKTKK